MKEPAMPDTVTKLADRLTDEFPASPITAPCFVAALA